MTWRAVGSRLRATRTPIGCILAGLALIDMVKAIDPAAVISEVRVEEKTGGKTGTWRRP